MRTSISKIFAADHNLRQTKAAKSQLSLRPFFPTLAALLLTLLAGCASDIANRYYASEKYPPKAIKDVEVLRSRPNKPFIVIADFQSRGETANDMRKRGAQIGADAVIVTFLGGYADTGVSWAGDDPYSNTYSRIIATAIRYK